MCYSLCAFKCHDYPKYLFAQFVWFPLLISFKATWWIHRKWGWGQRPELLIGILAFLTVCFPGQLRGPTLLLWWIHRTDCFLATLRTHLNRPGFTDWAMSGRFILNWLNPIQTQPRQGGSAAFHHSIPKAPGVLKLFENRQQFPEGKKDSLLMELGSSAALVRAD